MGGGLGLEVVVAGPGLVEGVAAGQDDVGVAGRQGAFGGGGGRVEEDGPALREGRWRGGQVAVRGVPEGVEGVDEFAGVLAAQRVLLGFLVAGVGGGVGLPARPAGGEHVQCGEPVGEGVGVGGGGRGGDGDAEPVGGAGEGGEEGGGFEGGRTAAKADGAGGVEEFGDEQGVQASAFQFRGEELVEGVGVGVRRCGRVGRSGGPFLRPVQPYPEGQSCGGGCGHGSPPLWRGVRRVAGCGGQRAPRRRTTRSSPAMSRAPRA